MQVVQPLALINTCGIDHLEIDRRKWVYPGSSMILIFNALEDRPME